jgi:hypothetical protein
MRYDGARYANVNAKLWRELAGWGKLDFAASGHPALLWLPACLWKIFYLTETGFPACSTKLFHIQFSTKL